jgi:pyruvate formate lyase activating enzyme
MDRQTAGDPGTGIDIRGFIESSLIEWPGRVAAAVFVAGCNWRCPYCHGWRFLRVPHELRRFPAEEVLEALERQRGWIDGVVLSGGEPTLQPGLKAFIEEVRMREMDVKLHSNGSRPEVVRALLADGLLACLALDLKAPLAPGPLARSTGGEADPEAVRASIRAGAAAGVELEFHTTLCPACLDEPALRQMADMLVSEAPGARWVWQQYNPGDVLDSGRAGADVYESEAVEAWADALRAVLGRIEVRGLNMPASSIHQNE